MNREPETVNLPGRMHCERLHADISVSTCLARRHNIQHRGAGKKIWAMEQFMTGGRVFDPGCLNCEQGRAVEEAEAVRPATTVRREPCTASLYIGGEMDQNKRVCKHCGQAKPPSDFYKMAGKKDGLDSSCRKCRNKMQWDAMKKRREKQKVEMEAIKQRAGQPPMVDYPLPYPLTSDTPSTPAFGSKDTSSPPDLKPSVITITIDCSGLIEALRVILQPNQ